MSENRQESNPQIIIVDGRDWPAVSAEDVREEFAEGREPSSQNRNVTLLTVMLGVLFLIYSTYAMVQGDLDMLRGGFDFVKLALAASVSWTFGRRSTSQQ